jgi:hypothetical protein
MCVEMEQSPGAPAAGRRAQSWRAVTGTTVLVARTESPAPVGESIGLAAPVGESIGLAGANRSVRPGAAAPYGWTASVAAAAVSTAGAVGRATVFGAAPLCGAHVLRLPTSAPTSAPRLATSSASATQADVGRRSACATVRVLREYCGYPGTAGVRALQLNGARARRPLRTRALCRLPARVCAGVHVLGVGASAAVHYSDEIQHCSACTRGCPLSRARSMVRARLRTSG